MERNERPLYISSIHYIQRESSGNNYPDVHLFYKDSFCFLYDLEEVRTAEQRETDWMIEALKNTMTEVNTEHPPKYFFDVRTTEEFSCPAPEYYLLKQLYIKHISPISVKGMEGLSLIQAFLIAEQYVQIQESALFCVAQRYHCYDNIISHEQTAVSFIVSKESGDYFLESVGFCRNYEEVAQMVQDNSFNMIYTDIELTRSHALTKTTPFLTQPLILLTSSSVLNDRILCISEYQGCYGYYIIRKE